MTAKVFLRRHEDINNKRLCAYSNIRRVKQRTKIEQSLKILFLRPIASERGELLKSYREVQTGQRTRAGSRCGSFSHHSFDALHVTSQANLCREQTITLNSKIKKFS